MPPIPSVRLARPTQGNGVGVATQYDANGQITRIAFCASTTWRLANAPDRADVTTCVTGGKLMQAVLGNSSWSIETPALGLIGLEAQGLAGGQIVDLFFFTTPPTYDVSTGALTSKGKAHWLKAGSVASDETTSNANADVQRLAFSGDGGTVYKFVDLAALTAALVLDF